jgi:hypothetical protein
MDVIDDELVSRAAVNDRELIIDEAEPSQLPLPCMPSTFTKVR